MTNTTTKFISQHQRSWWPLCALCKLECYPRYGSGNYRLLIANLTVSFSDADDCRRICEHGAKQLGYGSYQRYILCNFNLVSDDSDSDY